MQRMFARIVRMWGRGFLLLLLLFSLWSSQVFLSHLTVCSHIPFQFNSTQSIYRNRISPFLCIYPFQCSHFPHLSFISVFSAIPPLFLDVHHGYWLIQLFCIGWLTHLPPFSSSFSYSLPFRFILLIQFLSQVYSLDEYFLSKVEIHLFISLNEFHNSLFTTFPPFLHFLAFLPFVSDSYQGLDATFSS